MPSAARPPRAVVADGCGLQFGEEPRPSSAQEQIVNKRTLLTTLKYALALGLLGGVIYLNWDPAKGPGLQAVWQRHVVEGQPIQAGYFALAFVIGFAAVLTTFVRWYVLVRVVKLPFRMADAMRLGAIGFFYNTFLPGAVGGDAVKAWFLAKEHA